MSGAQMNMFCLRGTYVIIPGAIAEAILPLIGRDSLFWWDNGSLGYAISPQHTYLKDKTAE